MTGFVHISCSFAVTMRPSVSVGPPGGNGTMKRTGLVGQSVWPSAFTATSQSRRAVKRPCNEAMIESAYEVRLAEWHRGTEIANPAGPRKKPNAFLVVCDVRIESTLESLRQP